MRYLICIFVFAAVVSADIEYGEFQFDGYLREYIVFVPTNFEAGLPLVLNLPGYGMGAELEMNHTRMNEVADTANFVVVYPWAVDAAWNSGIGDSPSWPVPDVDDVAFISALIDTIHAHYQIDLDRVYSCGLSNGGFMSFRLACELSHRFDKIASVAGTITPTMVNACSTYTPIPLWILHGTSDPTVPWDGGVEGWYSVMETLEFWLDADTCTMLADTLTLPDMDPYDNCSVQVISYQDCTDETELIFYKVLNGGHLWPGSGFEGTGYGPVNEDISASAHIWNFFNSDSYEINGVWAHDLWRDTSFVEPGAGTLSIGAAITNTDDHSYTAYAVVFDANSSIVDSIELFDDGEHDDGAAGDGIAGAFLTAPETESFFFVQASAIDMETGDYLGPHDYVSFTTIGPLVLESLEQLSPAQGAIPPNTPVYFNLSLQNLGVGATAEDIMVQIQPADTNSTLVSGYSSAMFADIPPGETVESSTFFSLRTAADCEAGTPIRFNVDILSNGVTYWEDTGILLGYVGIDDENPNIPLSYSLHQNYPNPFNPTTTISYSLPDQSTVKLTVFDIRGQEVLTLQETEKPPGNYEVQWNGIDHSGNPVSTGVYFCRLKAGSYSQTIKMLYLK